MSNEVLTLAENIIEHGDNIAYPSRQSSKYVREVMSSLVKAFRDMETRALHAETVLAEQDSVYDDDCPTKWLVSALRDLARELVTDPKTTWIGERKPEKHICWTAADRLMRAPAQGSLLSVIEAEARRIASMYPVASDGHNTFRIFADWLASLATQPPAAPVEPHERSSAATGDAWPPLKMALWRVLMAENLNDGHYIKAFDLIEKLHSAAVTATEPQTAPYALSKKVHDVAADCENAAIVLQGQTYQVSAERLAEAYERIAASLRTALSLTRPQSK